MGRSVRDQTPVSGQVARLREDGRGHMVVDGKTYLVDDVLPGERVTVQPQRKRRGTIEARLLSVDAPSADRVVAACAAFGVCGGCRLQHMSRDAQVKWKQQRLISALDQMHVVRGKVLPPLLGDSWSYRRRARLAVKDVPAKGRVLVGFRERGKPYVAECSRCEILSPECGDLPGSLSRMIGQLSIRQAIPQVELAVGDSQSAMVFRVLEPPSGEDLLVLDRFGRDHAMRVYLQSGGPESVRPLDAEPPALSYRLPEFGLELGFEPTDFIQVNAGMNRAMIAQALDLLQVRPGQRVLDLFCGLGNFSLPLARHSGSVVGVDSDPGLIRRAQTNASRNSVSNVTFEVGDLYQDPVSGDWLERRFDRVLLDPPRTGAAQVLQHLPKLGPRRIVYVSCDPESFVRDARVLVNQLGYELAAVGIMDMFPHTLHVETMGLFLGA
jgi:23S rRNA (uracil1939-C5)-methyltransferase